jgi:hypothetical protein
MNYYLKILAASIMINLIMLWLFVEFVMKPIHEIAKAITEGLLR